MAHQKVMIVVRSAKINDALQLCPLMEQLGYPVTLRDLQTRLTFYADASHYRVFVAEMSQQVVGLVALVFYELFVFEGKRCRIEAFVVDENHRRQGIGRHLMGKVEIYAKEQGCRLVDLTSGVRRAQEGTHAFYKSLGYDNDVIDGKLYLRKVL